MYYLNSKLEWKKVGIFMKSYKILYQERELLVCNITVA